MLTHKSYFPTLLITLISVGFICSPITAEAKNLPTLLEEREGCITKQLVKQGYGLDTTGSEYNSIEWSCTVKIGRKYRDNDDAIIALYIRTHLVSGYTKDRGIAGSMERKQLKAMHGLGMFKGITINKQGNVRVSEAQMETWRTTCKVLLDFHREFDLSKR